MAHRSQCSLAGDNPLDPNYLPPHYREEYRLAIDALVEEDVDGYYEFLQCTDVVAFLSTQEIDHIKCTVQVPHPSTQLDLPYVDSIEDTSDTYWPIHSDLDAPGLDLGWPQLHRFIGPTEVTTLINPPEPDMPSIKEQARRLIKNAHQVIAVVMDMFTDVDIFSDILNAAMRNVPVYVILDEQNAHHFVTMASNCRVNLENIEFLRVRTVSGVTYRCRSGKSFKGQMMDRFLLTDCRAVLSGNYSFMWSFEKIHRCMAHLFLGQLVTTFDEEFRILFAQSEPLIPENVHGPVQYYNSGIPDSQYITDSIPLYRDPRKLLSIDRFHPVQWGRDSIDDRRDMVQKMMPPGRHEPIYRSTDQGPLDMYGNKYSSQQLRIEPQSFTEHGHPMILPKTIEFTGSKRHSYAGGPLAIPSTSQLMHKQDINSIESGIANQSRKIHREQHHNQRPGPEPGYGTYDQFKGHRYQPMDLYSESGYPHGMEIVPPDNYDAVQNYVSSSNLANEIGHGSDKLPRSGEVPFGQTHPRRLSVGQPYTCQTSPTQKSAELKPFVIGSGLDRKTQNPSAKQGMRDWRLSSFLSACDVAAEDDNPQPMENDPFEEPLNTPQRQPFPSLVSDTRFNAKELPKVPELRASCPAVDIIVSQATEARTTTTTPSESSSTTEGDKSEEIDVKEPKREEAFRRKVNPTVQRASRLRSSLIFSSQELNLPPGQDCEVIANEVDDQCRLSLTTQNFGKQKSYKREPFTWRLNKSATIEDSALESLKSDDSATHADNKELLQNPPLCTDMVSSKERPKLLHEEQTKTTPSGFSSKPVQIEHPKPTQPAHLASSSMNNTSYVDMNDADSRWKFFKELAAKRKAKAAQSEICTGEAPVKPDTPFDLTIKDPVTRIDTTLAVSTLNPADTSTKTSKEGHPVDPSTQCCTSKESQLYPADTSIKNPAQHKLAESSMEKQSLLTEAKLTLVGTSTEMAAELTEAQLENTSNKQSATSTVAQVNLADTVTKKPAQSKETALNQSDSVMKSQATLTEDSKNKQQEDVYLQEIEPKIITNDNEPPKDSTDAEIELTKSQHQILSKVTPRDTSAFFNRTSKQRTFTYTPKDFSLYKISPKEPKSSYLTSSNDAAKVSSLQPNLKETSLSNSISNPPIPFSKHATLEPNLTQSPTKSESSVFPDTVQLNSNTLPSTTPLQSSPLTNPDPVESRVSSNPEPIPMESSCSSNPAPKQSNPFSSTTLFELSASPGPNLTDQGVSLSTGQSKSSVCPGPVPTETSRSLGTTPTESNISLVPSQSELGVSPGSFPTEVNGSPCPIPTESSDSLGSILIEPRVNSGPSPSETSTSPGCIPTQSSASIGLVQTQLSASLGTILTESSGTPGCMQSELIASLGPTPTESSRLPQLVESSVSPGSIVTESTKPPGPIPTESSGSPQLVESSVASGSIITESSKPPGPILTESSGSPQLVESSVSSGSIVTESSKPPGPIPKESSRSPQLVESSVSSSSIITESSKPPGPILTESSGSSQLVESSVSSGSILTESTKPPGPIPTESNKSTQLIESSVSSGSIVTESTKPPGPIPKESSGSPQLLESSVSSASILTESTKPPGPIPTESSGSSQLVESSVSSGSILTESTKPPGPIPTESNKSTQLIESSVSSGSIVTESTKPPGPIPKESSGSPQLVESSVSSSSIVTESTKHLGPIPTESTGSPQLLESSVSSGSIVTESTKPPGPIPTESSKSPQLIESSVSSGSIITDSTKPPGPIPTESNVSSGSIVTESTKPPGPSPTESPGSPQLIESSVLSGSFVTESTKPPGPIPTESTVSSSSLLTESTKLTEITQTESSGSPSPNQIESSASPSSIPTESSTFLVPIPTESVASPSSIPSEPSPCPDSILTETCRSPVPIQTESFPSSGTSSKEPSLSSGSIATKLSASVGLMPTESSGSRDINPTESSTFSGTSLTESSETKGPDQTELSASLGPIPTDSSGSLGPNLIESSASPSSIPTESSASAAPNTAELSTSSGSISTDSSKYIDPKPLESSASPCPSSTESNASNESNASHDTVQIPTVVLDLSKGKPSNPSKNHNYGSCPASNGEKETSNNGTMRIHAPGESACTVQQSHEEAKENNSTLKLESKSEHANPISPPAKQAKLSQSHYHSSTANVISSSNLRDDTKLLLGQISANSQNRTELTKESAVTDDAKQDQVDRAVNAVEEASARQRSKIGISRTQEREILVQKMDIMRKQRKVYSRFEMPP
ncbi:hypothetical protein UPYG_G00321010 [Umbra pygmaea]|uniref:Scaffolding anchor of CK1 domain-containing protein n=1 Tax=Umbra pygmaea TaxID=75934 RepID=A0ABD0W539_UMBPY